MLKQFISGSQHNILRQESSSVPPTDVEVSIVKKGYTVFVYFENDLKLCIPIQDAALNLSGYNTFAADCAIRVYSL